MNTDTYKELDAAKEKLWEIEAELSELVKKHRSDPKRKSDAPIPEIEAKMADVRRANEEYKRIARLLESSWCTRNELHI